MQPPGSRVEADVAMLRIVLQRDSTVPDAGAAVDAFLTVENRHTSWTRRDRLPRAHLNAHLRRAAFAEVRIKNTDMIGKSGWRLHLAADQQRILVSDQ